MSRSLPCIPLQKPFNSSEHGGRVFQLAFPHEQIASSRLFQCRLCGGIPLRVPLQLRLPVPQSRAWDPALLACAMLMPEAAVDKYHLFPRRKYEVGFPGKILAVQAEAAAKAMNQLAHGEL